MKSNKAYTMCSFITKYFIPASSPYWQCSAMLCKALTRDICLALHLTSTPQPFQWSSYFKMAITGLNTTSYWVHLLCVKQNVKSRPELYFPGTADLWAKLKDVIKKKPSETYHQAWLQHKNRAWKLTFPGKQNRKQKKIFQALHTNTWPRMVTGMGWRLDKTIIAIFPTIMILWWATELLCVPVTIYFFHNYNRSSFFYHLSVITLAVPSAIRDR